MNEEPDFRSPPPSTVPQLRDEGSEIRAADVRPPTDLDDELRVLPPEGKSSHERLAEINAELEGEFEEEEPEGLPRPAGQFSLRDLMQIVLFFAIGFAALRIVPADWFAGVLGIATMLGLVLLTMAKPEKMIYYLVWWTLLGIYVISSAIAVAGRMGP